MAMFGAQRPLSRPLLAGDRAGDRAGVRRRVAWSKRAHPRSCTASGRDRSRVDLIARNPRCQRRWTAECREATRADPPPPQRDPDVGSLGGGHPTAAPDTRASTHPMSKTFAELGLPADIVAALAAQGIIAPFAIQQLTIEDALAGRDVLGKAKTGSCKTLAFGLPTLGRITQARPRPPPGLVLVPTRELATQVTE